MSDQFLDPVTIKIAAFLNEIGLPIRPGEVPDQTVLPGIVIENGCLIVDEKRLSYPGDLLHEAGHLAVVPPAARCSLTGNTGGDGGEEMAAIAWSYAAALHIGLAPAVVLHDDGYRGDAANIIENFREGRYFGVPFLQWVGLTDKNYPAMIKWLRK